MTSTHLTLVSAPPLPVDKRPVVISIRGLKIAFGGLEVLHNVDLDVHEAENVVVLGRSGSGKSVLIKIVVGLLRPDAGEVRVFGENVHQLDRKALDAMRRRVGFSFQSSALYDSMNVAQNLEFPLTMNTENLSKGDIQERVHDALEAVGLEESLKQMPSELSGGQRKRIGIARTLILRPEIMLYDGRPGPGHQRGDQRIDPAGPEEVSHNLDHHYPRPDLRTGHW